MGLKKQIRSVRFNKMVETATRLFEAADKGSEEQINLKAQLDQLEAEFSDDPAYLATVKMECKARKE